MTTAARMRDWQALLEPVREAYLQEVRRLAEELRPRFEAGELYGCGVNEDLEERLEDPVSMLEGDVRARIPDFASAYLILACSPAEAEDIPGDIHLVHAQLSAAECLVIDAFRLARELGWWKPRAGEWIGQTEWLALRADAAPAHCSEDESP